MRTYDFEMTVGVQAEKLADITEEMILAAFLERLREAPGNLIAGVWPPANALTEEGDEIGEYDLNQEIMEAPDVT